MRFPEIEREEAYRMKHTRTTSNADSIWDIFYEVHSKDSTDNFSPSPIVNLRG